MPISQVPASPCGEAYREFVNVVMAVPDSFRAEDEGWQAVLRAGEKFDEICVPLLKEAVLGESKVFDIYPVKEGVWAAESILSWARGAPRSVRKLRDVQTFRILLMMAKEYAPFFGPAGERD